MKRIFLLLLKERQVMYIYILSVGYYSASKECCLLFFFLILASFTCGVLVDSFLGAFLCFPAVHRITESHRVFT